MTVGDLLRVPPGGPVDLPRVDTRAKPGLSGPTSKVDARSRLERVGADLAVLQEKMYASAKVGGDPRRVLLVLQAMDCGGKDGCVRRVVGQLNPQGVRIVSFGVPTPEERGHDFLWRIRRALPEPGYVGVFNRSHYEDVLVPIVHGLASADEIASRYAVINRFEHELVGSGYSIVKVMLHISPEEQLDRLVKRLDDPEKRWKYQPGDVDERQRWDAYQAAYGDVLASTSTAEAPWHVVPADRKWYRDWAVASLLHEALAAMDPRYPEPPFDVETEKRRLTGR